MSKKKVESRPICYEDEIITKDYKKEIFEKFQYYLRKIADELAFISLNIETIRTLMEFQKANKDKKHNNYSLSSWLIDTLWRDLIIRITN